MSSDVEKAWLTELMKLCHFYRSNATVRQGLPDVQPITTVGESPRPPQPAVATPVIPGITAKPVGNLAKLLLASAGMVGAAGLGAGAMGLLQPPPPPPPAVEAPQDRQESLLQFLEDQGHHIYGPDRTDTP